MFKGAAIKFFQPTHLPLTMFLMQLLGLERRIEVHGGSERETDGLYFYF